MHIFKVLQVFSSKIPWVLFIALMVSYNGCLIVMSVFSKFHGSSSDLIDELANRHAVFNFIESMDIPRLVIGVILIFMAIPLLFRVRLAWFFSLISIFCVSVIDFIVFDTTQSYVWYYIFNILMLIFFWRRFDNYSLPSTTFFAVISLVSLVVYSILGSIYLGGQFSPVVDTIPTALYFSLVTLSTVGYGDIVPQTTFARMFTLSIILFGVTIFAASLSSLATLFINRNIKDISKERASIMNRKDHYIVVGHSPMADNICKALSNCGYPFTVVCNEQHRKFFANNIDIEIGNPNSVETLILSGAKTAKYLLVLSACDAENVFITLAAKEIIDSEMKVVGLVNKSKNILNMKRAKPDAILPLEALGGELLIKVLNGEVIDNNFIFDELFMKNGSFT